MSEVFLKVAEMLRSNEPIAARTCKKVAVNLSLQSAAINGLVFRIAKCGDN